MPIQNKILTILLVLSLTQTSLWAEDPHNNLVIVAGETWGSYTPANYDYAWPRYPYIDDISQRGATATGEGSTVAFSIFVTNRCISNGYYGNPPWSWMSGLYGIDFSDYMYAVEFNPTPEFANINKTVHPDANYAWLHYNHKIPGWDDPQRNYHDPVGGGAYLSNDRTHAWSTSAWPTQLGVDVKLTVHSWTMPWGHLDDFHLVEIELYNTGEADINADGVVDIHGNEIHCLCFWYGGTPFGTYVTPDGGCAYWQPNSRFRGFGLDLTPDEKGSPWNIPFQGYGSDPGEEDFPGLGDNGFYYDAYHGYNFLGAKKYDEATGTWVEKKLAFKDKNGNEVVPTVGEGVQHGWFQTWQPGYNSVNDFTPKGVHIAAMGSFYADGGKSNAKSNFNLNPNPNLFESGIAGDPTTFVVKDPSQWAYPDGAYEKITPRMAVDPQSGQYLGLSPMDPQRGRPLEPGIITEGLITEYRFDGDPCTGFGPISLKVGERVRVYFVRGSGFRMEGLRKTFKMARAVFASIKPDGSYEVPPSPPVPEIKVSLYKKDVSTFTTLVKWQDPSGLGDFDGIKIYKSSSWPRFNPLYKGFPEHETWWKTMEPNVIPDPVPYNPTFKDLFRIMNQTGGYWGPYRLAKLIPKSEFSHYQNPMSDADSYPYAWEDEEALLGVSSWYYVSTYKENASVPANYAGLDDVNWLESGKVNFNGRTGLWEGAWPHTELMAYYPPETDAQGRKDIGARFVLISSPAEIFNIELGRTRIGVRPNPYKRAAAHDVNVHQLLFYNLPKTCDISIYDVSGMLIDKIHFQAPTEEYGSYFWDMYSKNGNEVASGLYIWVVEYDGGKQMGYFSIIR
ncbi:MAG: hypothetical protein ONB05_02590 [candidate division KSB1 bacterium]|nr:hypothetical protein [candidate division KSB1 bacterium]